MNRIILIGNGFDLAHELETRYRNFLQWFWNDIAQKIWGGENAFLQEISTDDLCIKINTPTDTDCPDAFKKHDFPFLPEKVNSLKNLEVLIYQCKEEQVKICQRHNRNGKRNCRATLELHVLNKFLESISAFCDVENWVDIEQAYYLHLKKVVFNVPSKNPTLKDFPVSNPMLKDFHIQFERIKKTIGDLFNRSFSKRNKREQGHTGTF